MQGRLHYGSDQIAYRIVENERLATRVRIHVGPDGDVEVEAPQGLGVDQVQDAVQKRARWIVRHVEAAIGAKKHALPRTYVSGESHFYLGRRFKLIVVQAERGFSNVRLWRGRIEVALPVTDPAAVRRRLTTWYREKALAHFSRKLADLVERFDGVGTVPDFQLLAMEKQWGSCSPAGRLSLNPALIKAPVHCIEYVLLHELCHLVEHNHSKRFYALMDRYCPGWQAWKHELDGYAEQLLLT
ncbi:MAG TPA: SprT family zinc-dependent metalloprotease [Novosphingobium sp.]|nr:SprT family zinc-dependent metalloprotease [Novosphingobium sp.]